MAARAGGGAAGTEWKCPKCGRRFARARQAHSCQLVPLSEHLSKATPEAICIYEAVMAAVRACGPVQVAPTRTGINLLSATSLGSLSLRRDYANLGLVFTHRIENPRLQLLYKLSAQSFAYRVRVGSAGEVDRELKGWIREAYETGLLAGRRVR